MDVRCNAFAGEENSATSPPRDKLSDNGTQSARSSPGDSEAWPGRGEEVFTFAADATTKIDAAKVHRSEFCFAKGQFPGHTGPVASDADAGYS